MPKKGKQLLVCALIAAIFGYLTIFAGRAEASTNILSDLFLSGGTNGNTVSDNFSSDFYIDQPQSRYRLQDGKLYAGNGSVFSRIVSQAIAYSSYNIGSAKLEVSDFTPAGGRIVYSLSNDNGQTWREAQLSKFVNFSTSGKILRWSAVITRQSPDGPSPYIDSLTITYRYGYNSSLYRTNDNQRISDLSTVADALNDFYSDYGIYPHVSGTAQTAWNELMTLLSRNRRGGFESYPYLWAPVNDPLHTSDENITYNYDDLSSNEYILAATFQSEDDYIAAGGLRGTYGNITCSYPTYCIGVVRGAFSGGRVLGAYTTSSTTTNPGNWGLSPNSVVDRELNNMIGREIFRRSGFLETSSVVTVTNNAAGSNPQVAGASIVKAGGVTTGTTGSLALSLLLSGVVTCFYMGYTKTGIPKRREVWAVIRKHRSDKEKFNFANG